MKNQSPRYCFRLPNRWLPSRIWIVCLIPAMVLLSPANVSGQEISAEQLKFFETNIRPVLIKECYSCHSAKTGATRGGLMVDTQQALQIGGDSGPAIVPGDIDQSLLWSAINHEDYNMPPGKMLPPNVIRDFKDWIEMGAPDPRKTKIADIKSEVSDADIRAGREFWAFKKPVKPELPAVADDAWADSPIDRFIWAKLKSQQLPVPEQADAMTVLRRLTFDVVGLPPTLKQIKWMQRHYDRDPRAAIDHLLDELLASPRFGERWGRHWLDVARYAESSGREVNMTFPEAWRYRDYVIDAFNEDKPYDQFIQEQIAGDLLPVDSDQQWSENLTATGFLAIGPKTLSEQNGRQFRLDLVDEQVDVTSRVILGVSVACARCHDHKFDPIPQADYYAISGIFENTSAHYGTIDTLQNRRPSNLLKLPIKDKRLADRRLSKTELADLKKRLDDTRDALLVAQRERMQQRRNGGATTTAKKSQGVARLSSAVAALEAILNGYDDRGMPIAQVMGVQEVDQLQDTRLLGRGEFDQPGQIVPRGLPQVLCDKATLLDPKTSGRLELARWLGSDQNPLAARVMVNRIWQHLFGAAIVRTPENFGATGQAPTHPALLDWLAVRFVDEQWSVKSMIRQIALSRVYRSASTFNQSAFESDPTNQWRWRYEPRRLDAEAIRDAMLTVSGQMDLQRPAGSLVAEAGHGLVRDNLILAATANGKDKNPANQRKRGRRNRMAGGMQSSAEVGAAITLIDQANSHRSVYLPVVRDNVTRSMSVFDFAESSLVVGKRETSHTPDQGLYFLNNEFVRQTSEALADQLAKKSSNPELQIESAFQLIYGRPPTDEQITAAKSFFQTFEVSASPSSRVSSRRHADRNKMAILCQAIFASAEFRFLD